MPELPEVEITRQGIAPHLIGHRIVHTVVRERRLRWLIPAELEMTLKGQGISAVERRAKYLLLRADAGCILLHLGMSGSLRMLRQNTAAQKHDHVDIHLTTGHCLRFTDPRRFGALLWTTDPPEQHPLLQRLGPEPLGADFNGDYLYGVAQNSRRPVKLLIMDSHIVAGVGNIYANEALFKAKIHPLRAANKISLRRYQRLVVTIRQVLTAAIAQGGTTLRDFSGSDGKPGYFQLSLQVYGRTGATCGQCGATIKHQRLGQRSTYYCHRCQR